MAWSGNFRSHTCVVSEGSHRFTSDAPERQVPDEDEEVSAMDVTTDSPVDDAEENAESPRQPDEAPGTTRRQKFATKTAKQLERAVTRVVTQGVGPVKGAVEYAEQRLAKVVATADGGADGRGAGYDKPLRDAATHDEIERVIVRLVKEAVLASSSNGFLTSVGGFISLPVTLPVNVAGALVINARLAGAIAYLRGYDLDDPHVLTVVTLAAAGGSLSGTLSSFGFEVGTKLTAQAIKKIPMTVIRAINTRAGFMLVAKYGTQRSAVTLAKAIPFAGGVIGAGVDATLTTVVGRAAKKSFPRAI